MSEHEARYQLSRLHETLAELPALLRAVGIAGPDAADLAADAAALNTRLRAVREEHAARISTCATC
jgi:hypothetical protein